MPKGVGYSPQYLRRVVNAQKSQKGDKGPKSDFVEPLIKQPAAMKSLAANIYEGK